MNTQIQAIAQLLVSPEEAGSPIRAFYETVLDSLPLALFITDLDLNLLFANAMLEELTGKSRAHLLGHPCFALGINVCNTPLCSFQRLLHGVTQAHVTLHGKRYRAMSTFLCDNAGQRIGFIETIQAVSDHARQDTLLQSIVSDVPGGVFRIQLDKELSLLYASDFFYALHGYTPQQLRDELDNQIVRVVHPDDLPELRAILDAAHNTNQSTLQFQIRTMHRDGHILWVACGCHLSDSNSLPCEKRILSGIELDITAQKELEHQLRLSEERLNIALSHLTVAMWELDIPNRAIHQSSFSQHLFGPQPVIHDVPTSLVQNGTIHPDSVSEYLQMYERIFAGDRMSTATLRVRMQNDAYAWLKVTYTTILDDDGKPSHAIAACEDITETREARLRSQQQEQYRTAILREAMITYEIDLTADKVLSADHSTLIYPGLLEAHSYTGLLQAMVAQRIAPDDKEPYAAAMNREALLATYYRGEHQTALEYRSYTGDGKSVWTQTTVHFIQNPSDCHVYALLYVKNIDAQKQYENNLKEKAETDPLTHLYNRTTLAALVDHMLREAPPDKLSALLMVDLDNFKQINDLFGHTCGDDVLITIATKLRGIFREDGVIGRMGGDEFAVFLPDIPSREWACRQASNICKQLHLCYSHTQTCTQISASVGIAFVPEHGDSFFALYQNADQAGYRAKQQGKDQYAVYGQTPAPRKVAEWMNKEWLLDELDEIVYVSDIDTYDLLYINRLGRQLSGFSDRNCVGQKCYKVLQNLDAPCPFCTNALLAHDHFYTWEHWNPHLQRRFLLKDKLVDWEGHLCRIELAVAIDQVKPALLNTAE